MIEKMPTKEMGELRDHKPILLAGPGQGFIRVLENMCAEDPGHKHWIFLDNRPLASEKVLEFNYRSCLVLWVHVWWV